jgi:hypothetical protein
MEFFFTSRYSYWFLSVSFSSKHMTCTSVVSLCVAHAPNVITVIMFSDEYELAASVGWWSELLATDPEVLVRFPALPDFLRTSGSGTGSTQSREYN